MFGDTGSNRDAGPESSSHRRHPGDKFGSAAVLRSSQDNRRIETRPDTRILGCLVPFGSLFRVEKPRLLRGSS